MKALLLLAETAASHPDGTVSVLRAGITHVWASPPAQQAQLQGCIVVRIECSMGDQGPHQFDLKCLDEDGKLVMPAMQGQFNVPQGGGVTNLLIQFATAFPRLGRFTFYLRVDNVEKDTWTVTVATPPASPAPAGGKA
ncbi:MAG TPA: hypothetical protein VFY71_10310 [Planctomycetota bacterium]|nr:hypothetical protein [Planctomycetota bacterium]